MKTVVGLFDTFDEAKKAATDLENSGISHNDISIVANNESGQYAANSADTTTTGAPHVSGYAIGHNAVVGAEYGGVAGLLLGLTGLAIPGLGWIATAGWLGGMILGAATGAVVGGLVGAFTSVGVPEEDAYNYTEAVRRGGILLAVRSQDEQAQRVAEILGEDGAVNIDERVDQYRSEGYVPGAATAATTATTATLSNTATVPQTTQTVNAQGETVLPVVEESIALGKRQVQSGGVRVYSHVTERPVEESINLREEHVTVERHAVNRPVSAAEMNNLRDGVIEVTETAEVPVVAKEARIVEEVVVGKEATQRTETVHDTVRRTDVEVEQIAGTTTGWNSTVRVSGYAEARLPGDPDTDYPDPPSTPPTQGNVPGIQTGGHAVDGSGMPDTRGIMEKAADSLSGDFTDDKTGRPV